MWSDASTTKLGAHGTHQSTGPWALDQATAQWAHDEYPPFDSVSLATNVSGTKLGVGEQDLRERSKRNHRDSDIDLHWGH